MLENPWLKAADAYTDQPEVFKTENADFYSCDEDNVREFDDLFEKGDCDDLEEYKEYLYDELELTGSGWCAIEQARQLYHDKKQEAIEAKAEDDIEYAKENRRNK